MKSISIEELCEGIELQNEVKSAVLDFYQHFDFSAVDSYLQMLKNKETQAEARDSLKAVFGNDNRQIKILSCMLFCAAELYAWYREKGISEEIYFDTMKCFTRFIEECKTMTGVYAFDRDWWTSRQVGGTLFRIGALEYEMKEFNGQPVISLHIPSDANFTEESCNSSIAMAKDFFATYFEEYADADYICHSWLLAPELKELLCENSNILKFQRRFKIQKVDYGDTGYIEWVYKVKNCAIQDLPEKTSLQKRMKQYLLQSNQIGLGLGIMEN